MIAIDTNALLVLLIGLIDENLIERHKRTSIYTKDDYYKLLSIISDFKNLIVLPNIWTEVDNLLNNFSGDYKYRYLLNIRKVLTESSEQYIETIYGVESIYFSDVGITDTLLLNLSKSCDLLITSDSQLSDLAIANGILVYDLKLERNKDFK